MANLLDFYFLQLVQESDMDDLQLNLESSQQKLFTDQQYSGIASGYEVVQHAPVADLTVDIAGPGIAYDSNGQRMFLPAPVNLDVSLDSQAALTAVLNGGNERWITIYTQFERNASDLRFDGNGFPVNFRQDEGQKFVVVQGAEALAGTAVRPNLLAGAKLVADILIEFGTTQIVDGVSAVAVPRIESGDVVAKPLTRFPFMFNLTASAPANVRVGPLPVAMQAILTELNNHISGIGNQHPADAISTSNTAPGWTDLNPALNVQDSLDALPTDLGRETAGSPGAGLVGMIWDTIGWHDGDKPGNVNADTLIVALRNVVDDLAQDTGVTNNATFKIGCEEVTHNDTAASIASRDNLYRVLEEIVTAACQREQMDEEYAVIKQTDFPAQGQYRLIYESGFDAFSVGSSRMYMSHDTGDLNANAGICFTQNARWDTGNELWVPDIVGVHAERFGMMPNNGEWGARRLDSAPNSWGDDAWYLSSWGAIIETRLEGASEIASDSVGINCTTQSSAPIFTTREYIARYGALLDTDAANVDYGSVVNFPGSFFNTPTSFTFGSTADVNATSTPAVNGEDDRGCVVSRRSTASGFSWFAGDITVRP